MRLTCLIEDTSPDSDLVAEHGLSLYLEAGGRRILFDAGGTGAFADNAERLGVDLSRVDLAVVSHGHNDHGGGLRRFLSLNREAPVLVQRTAFEPHERSDGTDIGLDPSLLSSPRLIFVEDALDLGGGLSVRACRGRTPVRPIDVSGASRYRVRRDGRTVPDDFRHEQYLLVEEAGRRILVTGCSHRGVLNLLSWFAPDVLIGGLHLSGLRTEGPDAGRLREIAAALGRTETYTGHCTGRAPYLYLKGFLSDRLRCLSTGTALTI